jgi:phosphate uptake regulator
VQAVTWLAIALGITAFGLLLLLGQEANDAEAAHERADEADQQVWQLIEINQELIDATRAAHAREAELMLVLRHMGKAVEHAVNDDHDACLAMLTECVHGGWRD